VLGVSAVVLVTLLLGRGVRGPWQVAAAATALLGGAVGVSSAGVAIATMGGAPPYDGRVGLGWTALALAFAATVVGLATPARPVGSSVAMTLAGFMGAVAMSLFYMNTYCFAALPLSPLSPAEDMVGAMSTAATVNQPSRALRIVLEGLCGFCQEQEHGRDAAIHAGMLIQGQLGKDHVDVFLHGARSQHERLSDGRIGFALGHAGQHLALARRQISQWRVRGPRALPDQRLDHLGVDD
jgi:hypothetical protein